MSCRAFLALGSNIGDREENLMQAVKAIAETGGVRINSISNIYETKPVGYVEQSDFLNMAVGICTDLMPLELLQKMQKIEISLKRARLIHWGPRTIDIDILLYDNTSMDLPQLTIPHPRMFERAFVLVPLSDIYHEQGEKNIDFSALLGNCKDRDDIILYKKMRS
jgi:2-amino-4-hydroxy-6-hydroxymethyldihydropteridine diphosphokinase